MVVAGFFGSAGRGSSTDVEERETFCHTHTTAGGRSYNSSNSLRKRGGMERERKKGEEEKVVGRMKIKKTLSLQSLCVLEPRPESDVSSSLSSPVASSVDWPPFQHVRVYFHKRSTFI